MNDQEKNKKYIKASEIIQFVREHMNGKASIDFRTILSSAIGRELSEQEFTSLGLTPNDKPQELITRLEFALLFEAYFTGDSKASIPVTLLSDVAA